MALVLADRVLETSTSEGLGTFALAGAQTGYQTFSSGIGNGNTCYYTINGQTTEQWEVGIGTVGAGTLARTTLISSNTGSFINFVAGVKNVFVTQPASKSIYKDENGNAIPLGSASATQLDITAQGDLRLQDTTGGQYVALQAPSTIATSYTLTMPADDGTAGQALVTDGSGVLSWSSAASGDVYGPASATDNAVARFDGTTGKIVQNSVVTIADTTGNMTGVGTLGVGAITTSGALTYGGVTLSNSVTGTGSMVLATSPTLVTPALGTPSSGVVTNLTGTASININGTVGATTPNTGNFTTLTENSSPAVVQTDIGTAANEIPLNQYLGNLAYQNATNIAGQVGLQVGTAAAPSLVSATNTNTGMFFPAADTIAFAEGGVEVIRITNASNVGIGTSSPSAKLSVGGSDAPKLNLLVASGAERAFIDYTEATSIMRIDSDADISLRTNNAESIRINAFNNVGIGTASPNASAILDVQSTTKGVRMPNMTTAQKNAIVTPAAGLMVYDTTLSKLCVYSGLAWETVTSV
jgi:hypothetical protein